MCNAHQFNFFVYIQNVNVPDLAKKQIFCVICGPLAGQPIITLHEFEE